SDCPRAPTIVCSGSGARLRTWGGRTPSRRATSQRQCSTVRWSDRSPRHAEGESSARQRLGRYSPGPASIPFDQERVMRRLPVCLAALAALLAGCSSTDDNADDPGSAVEAQLDVVRSATHAFHNLEAAVAAGYPCGDRKVLGQVFHGRRCGKFWDMADVKRASGGLDYTVSRIMNPSRQLDDRNRSTTVPGACRTAGGPDR